MSALYAFCVFMEYHKTMKLKDIPVIGLTGILAFFFAYPETRSYYESAYKAMPILLTFFKFAFLATAGEMVALRVKEGIYYRKDFGVVPKMIIWGVLGIFIYFAFIIFSTGVPNLMPLSIRNNRILQALLISVFMNIIFAPIMMITHHITDNFIHLNKGKFRLSQFNILNQLKDINWEKMWSFVFLKTIPLFWIPAHTITFLLKPELRTVFAASLSVVLGIFLGIRRKK